MIQRQTQKQRVRKEEGARERERERTSERTRKRERERERETDTERGTERERERERERDEGEGRGWRTASSKQLLSSLIKPRCYSTVAAQKLDTVEDHYSAHRRDTVLGELETRHRELNTR
jgi:hypothetical protein